MIHLDYRDARPIYSQICDGIREQILTGILCPGDRMPSVRELATELTINPNTIQRSYRQLEEEGWIASVPGKGSFVCDVPTPSKSQVREIWDEFEKLRQRFAACGIGTQDIIDHLTQGGNDHA